MKKALMIVGVWLMLFVVVPMVFSNPVAITGKDSTCGTSYCEIKAEFRIPAAYKDGIVQVFGDYNKFIDYSLTPSNLSANPNIYTFRAVVKNELFGDAWEWGIYYRNPSNHNTWGFLDPYVNSSTYAISNFSDTTELLDIDVNESRVLFTDNVIDGVNNSAHGQARMSFLDDTWHNNRGLDDGLVFGWRGEDTYDFVGGLTGTLNGGLTIDDYGYIGGGAYFDGTDDRINYTDADYLDMKSNDWSISVWVKTTGAGSRAIFSKGRSTTTEGYFVYLNNGQLYFHIHDGTNSVTNSFGGATVNDGNWHHLVYIFDRDGSAKGYIDGTQSATTRSLATIGDVDNTHRIYIGRRGLPSTSWHFYESIDELYVWNRSLSAAEIRKLYNEQRYLHGDTWNNATSFAQVVGAWDFTNASNDWRGDTVYMNYSYSQPNWTNNLTCSGIVCPASFNAGAYFDGSDDYLENEVNGEPEIDLDDFMIGAWFRTTDTTGSIVSHYSNSNPRWMFRMSSSKLNFLSEVSGGYMCQLSSSDALNDNLWHYGTLVVDRDGNCTLYIDGSKDTQTSVSYPASSVTNSKKIRIGANPYTGYELYYNGYVANSQIITFGEAGELPTGHDLFDDDLIAYYRLNKEDYRCTSGNCTDELLLNMHFDVNLTNGSVENITIDNSTYEYNGTSIGSKLPIFDSGMVGNGSYTFANGDYVTLGDVLEFEYDEPVTISMWLNTNDDSFFPICKMTDGGDYDGWRVYLLNGEISYGLREDAAHSIAVYGDTDIRNTGWRFITTVYDGSNDGGGVKIYLDGEEDTPYDITVNNPIAGTIQNNVEVTIGGRDGAGNYVGGLDEIKIWNYTLTTKEILREYNDGLRNYTFNFDADTTIINDSTNYSNWAILNSTVYFKNSTKNLINATINDAGADYVHGQTLNHIGWDEGFSLSAWVKPHKHKYGNEIIYTRDGEEGFGLAIDSNNIPRVESGEIGFGHLSASEAITMEEWHHIVGTYEAGIGRNIYVDGVLSNTDTDDDFDIGNQEIVIGLRTHPVTPRYFNGSIDEVMIFNKTLTASEVYTIYQRGIAGIPENIADYINFTYNKQHRQINVTSVPIQSAVNITVLRANYSSLNHTGTLQISADNGSTWDTYTPNQWYYVNGIDDIMWRFYGVEDTILTELTIENYYGTFLMAEETPADGSTWLDTLTVPFNCSANTTALLTNITHYSNRTGVWAVEGSYEVNETANETYYELNVTFPSNGYYGAACRIENIDNVTGALDNNTFLLNSYNPPNVTLIYPGNHTNNTDPTITFTGNVTDDLGIEYCWFMSNLTGVWKIDQNYSVYNATSYNLSSSGWFPAGGNYTWNFICNDTRGDNSTNANYSFYRVDNPPLVTLIYPGNNSHNNDTTLTLIGNASDDYGIDTCLLYTDLSGVWQLDATYDVGTLTFDLAYGAGDPIRGTYNWQMVCNDSFNQLSTRGNFTFLRIDPPPYYELCDFDRSRDPYVLEPNNDPCTILTDIMADGECSEYNYSIQYRDTLHVDTKNLRVFSDDMYYFKINRTPNDIVLRLCNDDILEVKVSNRLDGEKMISVVLLCIGLIVGFIWFGVSGYKKLYIPDGLTDFVRVLFINLGLMLIPVMFGIAVRLTENTSYARLIEGSFIVSIVIVSLIVLISFVVVFIELIPVISNLMRNMKR